MDSQRQQRRGARRRELVASTRSGPVDIANVANMDATAPEHVAACLWCYRFYRRTMQADDWQIVGAARSHKFIGSSVAPANGCASCEGNGAMLLLFLTRRRAIGREWLVLAVCRTCGHVEPRNRRLTSPRVTVPRRTSVPRRSGTQS
jgi:hypothetical protein